MIPYKDQSTRNIVNRVPAVSLDFEVESGVHQDVPGSAQSLEPPNSSC